MTPQRPHRLYRLGFAVVAVLGTLLAAGLVDVSAQGLATGVIASVILVIFVVTQYLYLRASIRITWWLVLANLQDREARWSRPV